MMGYTNKLALLRTGLTMLITESVKAAGGHISTYYKSTGIPYQNIHHEEMYETPPIEVIINPVKFSGAETVTLMHMSVKRDGVLRIIYNDSTGNDCNTIADYITLESICDIVRWLQREMLLLAPREAEACSHCGSLNIQKESMVEINNNNAFVKYYDEVGTEGNWCPNCQHTHYAFCKYDQTNIPIKVLNHWWARFSEEQKNVMLSNIEFIEKCKNFAPDEKWICLSIDIKRKIWCNYRKI